MTEFYIVFNPTTQRRISLFAASCEFMRRLSAYKDGVKAWVKRRKEREDGVHTKMEYR